MGRTPIDSQQMQIKKSRSTFRIENPESVSGVQLPVELITEILQRLPVKSLLKCKCVSKSWLSLISSPEFIRSHFSLSCSREGQYSHHQLLITGSNSGIKGCSFKSALVEPSTHVVDIEFPYFNPNETVCVIGVVNGLVCLATERIGMFIWNPALRKSKHLPSLNVDSPKKGRHFNYGFGYDESNDDYKVVCLQCHIYGSGDGYGYETEVKVYSLMADSWRRIEDFKGGIPLYDLGTYVGGKIHWNSFECISALCIKVNILTLDMVSEKFGELQRPDIVDPDAWPFGLSGGRLFVGNHCNLKKKMDLWVMNKYGVEESWSKVVTIPYDGGLESKLPYFLCVLRNGEIVLGDGSCLLVYHPKHKEFRKIELDGCNSDFNALVYVESLVWPNELRL